MASQTTAEGKMGKRQMVTDADDWRCIERIAGEWFFVNGLLEQQPNGKHDTIDMRLMIARLQNEYPRFGGLDDGRLAVMVCRILSEDYPTPTPAEALQRKVAAPVGAYLQIVRRQQVQAEADRLASLGQLTPVSWHDDDDTPAERTPCKSH